jgi:hypothetical protein
MAPSYVRFRAAALEAVAHHPQRFLDQSEAGQGLTLGGMVCCLTQNPKNLSYLGLREPDLDFVHEVKT